MKHLSQMTREELWLTDRTSARKLYMKHFRVGLAEVMKIELQDLYTCLDTLRLELQQQAAENEVESHREYWRGEGRVDGLTDR